jgi:hypothetical protein
LLTAGQLPPSWAIDLGSGSVSNIFFLAQHSFEVSGVDFARAAIEKRREMFKNAGVNTTVCR